MHALMVEMCSHTRVVASTEKSLERSFGSEYLLTYVDEDMLVGSQTGTGGTFIFNRAALA